MFLRRNSSIWNYSINQSSKLCEKKTEAAAFSCPMRRGIFHLRIFWTFYRFYWFLKVQVHKVVWACRLHNWEATTKKPTSPNTNIVIQNSTFSEFIAVCCDVGFCSLLNVKSTTIRPQYSCLPSTDGISIYMPNNCWIIESYTRKYERTFRKMLGGTWFPKKYEVNYLDMRKSTSNAPNDEVPSRHHQSCVANIEKYFVFVISFISKIVWI